MIPGLALRCVAMCYLAWIALLCVYPAGARVFRGYSHDGGLGVREDRDPFRGRLSPCGTSGALAGAAHSAS